MTLEQVEAAMDHKSKVLFNGMECTVTGCMLRRENGKRYYQLELQDPCGHSIMIADMERVNLTEPG